jgi:deoxyribodipyrimidine photo-lyase
VEEVAGDQVAEPDDLPGRAGGGHRVFTPFWRAWRDLPLPAHIPAPSGLRSPRVSGDDLSRLPAGDPPLPAGAQAARRRLVRCIRDGDADRYDRTRDLPGEDATSHLSAYLRLGMCTAPQIGRGLGLPGDLPPGREAFWRQVCWREFLHHHLARHPQVLRGALLPEFRRIEWEDDDDGLAAWTRGETGFPIVDAGMRQLAQEGWVHNRARMVVASFLVKDLGIDWRRGETAFMRGLVDGDPASNNGGWQWVAGTGTDAAPYFRVLNPVLQSRRFDPAGAYIRRHVPELRDVPDDRIHEPWRMDDAQQAAAGCRIGRDYPAPVLDHGERRERALERYRRVRGR